MHQPRQTPAYDAVDGRQALHQRHSHSVLIAHVVWSTRARQSLLPSSADSWFDRFFRGKAEELGAHLLASGYAEDHVHLVLRYPATRSLVEIVHRLKGASSREWNLEPAASSARLAWQVGYWAESVTPSALAPLVHYVNRQRQHHADGSTSPAWEPSPSPRTPPPDLRGQ